MLIVERVMKRVLPEGHWWAIVERDGVTTAYVVDGHAERVARSVYSNSNRTSTAASASVMRSSRK